MYFQHYRNTEPEHIKNSSLDADKPSLDVQLLSSSTEWDETCILLYDRQSPGEMKISKQEEEGEILEVEICTGWEENQMTLNLVQSSREVKVSQPEKNGEDFEIFTDTVLHNCIKLVTWNELLSGSTEWNGEEILLYDRQLPVEVKASQQERGNLF